MPGFQIGSSCEGWNLDSREMDPIYKTCEDLGAVLFVHPWDMQMGGRMSKYWLPWLVRTEIPLSKIPSYLQCIGRNASRNCHCRLLYSYGRSPSEVSQAEGKDSSWWFCLWHSSLNRFALLMVEEHFPTLLVGSNMGTRWTKTIWTILKCVFR